MSSTVLRLSVTIGRVIEPTESTADLLINESAEALRTLERAGWTIEHVRQEADGEKVQAP